MGGKTSTTESTTSIPPAVLKRYNEVNARAEKLGNRKFKNYKGEFVAPVNQQQLTGTQTINDAAGMMQPYLDQAQEYTRQGAQTVSPQELDIAKYYNPYQQEVIDSTSRLIDQGNEQAMSGSLGDAIKSGTFGGDRSGIAAAVLAGQQQMSRANTLAGLKQQGYQQAMSTAQQQQGVDLGARQADLARYTQAGQQTAGLGQMAQQGALAAGESQINAGTLQQQTQQAQDTAKYQQFLQRQGYPFQLAQFMANIAMGTGSLSGSTTTTTQPAPFFSDRRLKTDIKRIGKSDDGLPIYTYRYKGDDQLQIGMMADEVEEKHPEAVGRSLGYKTVDYEKATDGSWRDQKAEGGSVYGSSIGANPYGQSYVPEAYLKVGELMRSNTDVAKPTSALEEMSSLASFGKQMMGLKDTFGEVKGWFDGDADTKALGGSVGSAPYLQDKDDEPKPESYISDTIDQQDKDTAGRASLMESKPAPPPQSGASSLGQAAGGVGSLLSGIAGLFALSDPRAKTDKKRIGRTDNGLPIYRFKYKGDDKEQMHIGMMADEVEERHPESVVTGNDGLKRVNLGHADKFAHGGYARGMADHGSLGFSSPAFGSTASLDVQGRSLGGRAGYLEGGEIEEDGLPSLDIVPEGKQYKSLGLVRSLGILPKKEEFVSEDADKSAPTLATPSFKETPHRYTPPGFHPSNLDTDTLVRDDPLMAPVKREKVVEVPALETRTLGDMPKIADAVEVKQKPLFSVDVEKKATPRISTKNRIFNGFMNTVKEKIDNPYALAAVAATGDRESKFSPHNANRTWNDPSQSGIPGRAGHILSWRGPRHDRLVSYAADLGEDANNISPETQAKFFLQEDPALVKALNNAKSVEEAQGLMNRAWAFAGYDNPRSAETRARFDTARKYFNDMGGMVSDGFKTLGDGAEDVVSGAKTLGHDISSGTRTLGSDIASGVKNVASDTTSGFKNLFDRASGNQDIMLSVLSGLGTMASSPSRYLGSAILQGIGGGASTYANLRGKTSELDQQNLENTQKLTDAWQQYINLNPQESDLSLTDFAKQRGYERYLPQNNPIDIVEGSDSKIKLANDAGSNVSGNDESKPTYSYTPKEMNEATVDGIPAFNNPAYLTAFIAKNAAAAEASKYLKAPVEAAREQLARIQSTNTTYNSEGRPEIAPGIVDVQSQASQADTNRKTKAAFTESLPERAAAINNGGTTLAHLEDAMRAFQPGAGAEELSNLAAFVRRIDPNDTSGVASTLQSAGIDPGKIQEAKKLASVYLAQQLKNMPGGAPASTMEFLSNITPDVMMQPEAARAIIVRAKADLLSQKAFLDAAKQENPANISAFEAEFYNQHPLEEFIKIAEEATPALGVQKEEPPPSQAEIDAMTPEERKLILGE